MGTCVFTGVGERIREGNELYYELSKRDIISRVVMIFGQMNEPPGARFGVAMSGITIAESIQRKNKDVLLFVDNIFNLIDNNDWSSGFFDCFVLFFHNMYCR